MPKEWREGENPSQLILQKLQPMAHMYIAAENSVFSPVVLPPAKYWNFLPTQGKGLKKKKKQGGRRKYRILNILT